MNQFVKFIFVGFVNTVLGFGVIFFCMYGMRLEPEISNFIGYSIGLFASFLLNRNYVFNKSKNWFRQGLLFFTVFFISYVANLLVLMLLVHDLKVQVTVSQIIAGIIYVAVSYALNKNYVFHRKLQI